jgi:hypothetical protein
MDDEEMFADARVVAGSEGHKPVLSVVTCTWCGCLVVDTDQHSRFHLEHSHAGFGFERGH